MALAQAGIAVVAILLICPFEAYSGTAQFAPNSFDQFLRNFKQHEFGQHHQRSQSNHQHNRNNHQHHLRWSRPQEFEIIQANKEAGPVLVLGKHSHEQDDREVNDPVLLDLEVKPIDNQYEIIASKDVDHEQKPDKLAANSSDNKPGKKRKAGGKPKASVHENIAVNSFKYSKVSKLNK